MTAHPWLRVFALAPLLLFVACSDQSAGHSGPTGPPGDDPGPPPDDNPPGLPAATFLVKAVLDASGGTVTVTDGSVPVVGATVRLNGTLGSPTDSDGEYEVRLPNLVATGTTMGLEVWRGETRLYGIVTVPEAPVMIGASSADGFDPGYPFRVSWSSATNPRKLEVVAVGASTKVFPVLGSTSRDFTIPGGSLGKGDWSIRVRATNIGTMSGDEEPYSSIVIRADATSPTSVSLVPLLLLRGDVRASSPSVKLIFEGQPVDGATVTINGMTAAQAAPAEPYVVNLPSQLAPGSTVTLSVAVGADLYSATGTVPDAPVVTIEQWHYERGEPIPVSWTAGTNPDRFVIRLSEYSNVNPFYAHYEVPGSARAFTIPGEVPQGEHILRVYSTEDGVFTGGAHPASRMGIQAGASEYFVVGQW